MKHFLFLFLLLALVMVCSQNVEVVQFRRAARRFSKARCRSKCRATGASRRRGATNRFRLLLRPISCTCGWRRFTARRKTSTRIPNGSHHSKDPVDGRVWCTDCHISGQIRFFSKIPKMRTPWWTVLKRIKLHGRLDEEVGGALKQRRVQSESQTQGTCDLPDLSRDEPRRIENIFLDKPIGT